MSGTFSRVSRWAAEHPLLAIVLTLIVLVSLVLALWAIWPSTAPAWSGFEQGNERVTSRTLWDWLELLIVPAALLLAAWWISRATLSVRHEAGHSAGLSMLAQDIELENRYQEGRLQTYFNRIGRLLLDHGLRNSDKDDEVRRLARAQTLTVLWGLNGERKGALIRFLQEAELILNPDPTISLAGANLSSADLRSTDLRDADLHKARLIKANLTLAQLDKTDLTEADLTGADLRGALSTEAGFAGEHWTPPNLSNANLNEVILREANLSGIELTGATLNGANLEGADLREAILSRSNLSAANLGRANLSGANLRTADLAAARLAHATLSGAIVTEAKLTGADLEKVHATQANLRECDLSNANLAQATLTNAFLQNAILRAADLSGANLRGANLSGADLIGATLDGADLRGAYLSSARVDKEQLSAVMSLEGATLPGTRPTVNTQTNGQNGQTEGNESDSAEIPDHSAEDLQA